MMDTLQKLTQDLIRCASVTPETAGVFDVLRAHLEPLGFECHTLSAKNSRDEMITSLFARYGSGAPHFCFAGHVDVVPTGKLEDWTHPPFSAHIEQDVLYGRGASDMKGAVAAFAIAAQDFMARNTDFGGSISLLIAGDEEATGAVGTDEALKWLKQTNGLPDLCLVGEPTNPDTLGQMIKVGRRGSLSGRLNVDGVQGHAAYPHLADNPIPKMVDLLSALKNITFDEGSQFFQPTNLEIVTVDTGNTADNVIPAHTTAQFNVRFNDLHTSQGIKHRIHETLDQTGHAYALEFFPSGESFLTEPGPLSDAVKTAVAEVTGRTPDLTTTGGTSDARFISQYCPVVEFGAVGASMHKVDENIPLSDLDALCRIYGRVLDQLL